MKTETAIKIKVYYDPSDRTFKTIRGVSNDGFIVSVGAEFYDDSKTTIMEEIISDEKFSKLIRVDNIKNFPYSEIIDLGINGIPYLTYIVTKNPSIKKMSLIQLKSLLDISVEEEDYEKASEIKNQINSRSCQKQITQEK